ncbi:hypothetical protein [Micromonospora zhanjiangensis]|uniref:Uncharacterized protein n=1 Tax=Micromonospora zhanjiangensis TaxID=1522057 RepID=A0ABV8KLX9_9ACTN
MDLFGPPEREPAPKPASDQVVRLEVLVTVKAAPNPSEKYGETVCVAGVSTDLRRPGWVRLYPINFRELSSDENFRKYDVISVDATPARQDQRRESWRPRMTSMVRLRHLEPWKHRRAWLDQYVEDSMCRLNQDARIDANAKSLSLVRPREVGGLTIKPHPGWTPDEQRRIDAYVSQLDLFSGQDRTPLAAPRFKAAYRYRCHDQMCNGHQQGLIDWEFVALQRRLRHLTDGEIRRQLEDKFVRLMCDPSRDVAFYVGNQAKRAHVFSVLGVYYPKG